MILALRSLFLQLTHEVTEKGSVVVCSLFSFGDASLRRDDGRVGPVVERWETDPANYSYQRKKGQVKSQSHKHLQP